MAIRDLLFNILAKDKTGAAFESVSRKLKGIEGAARSTQERIKSAGRGMRNFGLAASAATAGIVLSFSDVLTAYDDAASAAAKVTAAVKSTGAAAGFTAEQLFDMAAGLQDVTRFDGDAVLDGVTAQLLTFDKVQGDVFKRAQMTALDLSTVLNQDLKSSSIMLGKALNDPARGLSALRRVGISFTEDQENVIKSLAATGKVAEAQGLILDAIAAQGYDGQAAAAALAGIGPLIQLQNAWGDLKEEVGRVIAEIMPPVVAFFKGLVNGFLGLPEPMRNFTVVLGLIAAAAGPVIAAFGLLVMGLGAVSAPVLAVVAGIAALTAAVVAFWPQITALAGFIADTAVAAWDGFTAAASATVGVMTDVVGWVGEKASAAFTMFKEGIASVMADPLTFGQNLLSLAAQFNPVTMAVEGLWNLFKTAFPESAQFVADMVVKVKEWLIDKLAGYLDTVKGMISSVGDAFYELWDRVVGHSYVPDLVDDVGREFDRLPGEMVDPALAATEKTAGSFKDMAKETVGSLLDLAAEGKLTFNSFLDTILQSGMKWADQIIANVFDTVADAAANALGGAGGGGGGGFLGGILSGIGGALGIPGLDTGGEAGVVGGRAGIDRNLVRLRLSEGEKVEVTRRGQPARAANVTVNIHTPNPAAFAASRTQLGAQLARAVAAGQRGA